MIRFIIFIYITLFSLLMLAFFDQLYYVLLLDIIIIFVLI